MKPMSFIKKIDNLPGVTQKIIDLSKRRVLVGVPGKTTLRGGTVEEHQKLVSKLNKAKLGSKQFAKVRREILHHDSTDITNASIAFIQDKGSEAAHIPARPFLSAGIEAAKGPIGSRMAAVGRAALRGDAPAVERGLHAVGLTAVNAVKRKITTGPFQPLKKSTLAARRRRGVTRTKPLIDTGQLRNAQSYVVK